MDIADAMILRNLFAALFDRGVTLVTTPNSQPDELYHSGLQRQRFLPAAYLIRAHTELVHVDGPLDYRLRVLERADVYQQPISQSAERALADYFSGIAPDEGHSDIHISILADPSRAGRKRKASSGSTSHRSAMGRGVKTTT